MEFLQKSLNQLPPSKPNEPENWSSVVQVKRIEGSLLEQQGKPEAALKAYTEAFDTLKTAWDKMPKVDINTEITIAKFLPKEQRILSANVVTNLHEEFLELLSKTSSPNKQQKIREVRESLIAHLFAELNFLMEANNWKDADSKNDQLMLYIAGRKKEGYFDELSVQNFPCNALGTIDKLWQERSGGEFGFRVQKDILDRLMREDKLMEQPTGYEDMSPDIWSKFVESVGLGQDLNTNKAQGEKLPSIVHKRFGLSDRGSPSEKNPSRVEMYEPVVKFLSRVSTCDL